jgi:ribosomal-protein-serine acetyltransferase
MPVSSPSRKETFLTDGTISLRPHRREDAEAVYEAARESLADMYPWMPWAHKDYSFKESRQWMKKGPHEWKKGTAFDFAILDARDGSFLGGCGINRIDFAHRWANLGYWVRSSRAGKGIAPAATILLARWAFEKLGLLRIEIAAAAGNSRSRRVAEKAGAKFEGMLRNRFYLYGQSHDAALYSLVPGDLAPFKPPA